jgi:glycosyltransferase involved in cell wall biosynthesis
MKHSNNITVVNRKAPNKPVFSVVMPMYNVEQYVQASIQSVLDQSYPNFEILCINDGCTDATMAIVNQFSDARIRIINQENRGLSGARNTGINHCQGLYVAFLDSDDLWHKDKLKCHLEHFRRNPDIAIAYSASEFINEEGELLGIGQHPKLKHITPQDIFCRNPIGNGSAAVFRHSVLMQMGQQDGLRTTYFDEHLRQSEDVDFWLRVALHNKEGQGIPWKFEGIEQSLTYYRVNASGLSANLDKQLASWEYATQKNSVLNPSFFKRWYPLALAYQKRYLARRAIQSHNGLAALYLINAAIKTDIRVLTHEPKRTLVTYGCAVWSLLPAIIYSPIEKLAMFLASKQGGA